MAYTAKRRQTTEQRIDSAGQRLEYLRGHLGVVEALEDLSEGYRVTIKGVDEPLRAGKQEMVDAVRERIRDTEHEIERLERTRRAEQGLPLEPVEAVISMSCAEEHAMWATAAKRRRLLAGA